MGVLSLARMNRTKKLTVLRIGADIIILFLIFLVPWWFSYILLLGALFFFDSYFEILYFGFLLDALYAQSEGISKYLFLTIGFVLFSLQIFVKKKLRI